VDRLLVDGAGAGAVNGVVVDVGASLEAGVSEAGAVDGGADYGSFLAVVGLEAGTVLALGNVNDRVVRAVLGIELDTRLGVGRLRLAVLLAVDKLFADAGTAVLLLFTSDADLFSAGRSRQMCVGLE
jgi:hypothetical protein